MDAEAGNTFGCLAFGQFWFNGVAMLFIKNLFVTATLVNIIFSAFTLFYFYNVIEIGFWQEKCFLFRFDILRVSVSGLAEHIRLTRINFFFFVVAGFIILLNGKALMIKRYIYC